MTMHLWMVLNVCMVYSPARQGTTALMIIFDGPRDVDAIALYQYGTKEHNAPRHNHDFQIGDPVNTKSTPAAQGAMPAEPHARHRSASQRELGMFGGNSRSPNLPNMGCWCGECQQSPTPTAP